VSSENIAHELGARIKAAREAKGVSQAALSKSSGVSQAFISQAEQGKREPGAGILSKLAQALDVSVDFLMTGHDPLAGFLAYLGIEVPKGDEEPATAEDVAKLAKLVIASLTERQGVPVDELPQPRVIFSNALDQAAAAAGQRTEDFRAVPLVEDAVAAGAARVVSEQVEGWAWVYAPLLGRRKNLVAVRVKGDSMSPVLPDGSVAVVDRDDRKVVRRGLYVVRIDGGCTIKYVAREGTDLVLIPENREHRETRIPAREGEAEPIVGRVVWSWRVWV
jgi:phage repressor protein C with HTH and peptisase S24 domain/DNA-binding XRE family transcriptional regulator